MTVTSGNGDNCNGVVGLSTNDHGHEQDCDPGRQNEQRRSSPDQPGKNEATILLHIKKNYENYLNIAFVKTVIKKLKIEKHIKFIFLEKKVFIVE